MSKFKVQTHESIFVFETVMRVRNTEIDVGQYLTIESLASLLIEARARFFFSRGIKDINADYHGLIAQDMVINMISRVRAREELLFEVGVSNLAKDGGDLMIKVSRMYDNTIVAKAQISFVNYDYRANEVIPMSPTIVEALDTQPFQI